MLLSCYSIQAIPTYQNEEGPEAFKRPRGHKCSHSPLLQPSINIYVVSITVVSSPCQSLERKYIQLFGFNATSVFRSNL